MSITRAIAHNTLSQIIGKIFSTLLGLVAIGMMTRYLGQEQFGWYITAISFLQFVGILIDFGLIPVTSQMMSEPAWDKTKLFKNLLGFRFVTAVVFLGLAPLVAMFFPYPPEVKMAIAFTTLSFLGVAMNQVLIGLYQTKLKMHIAALGELAGRIALVVGLWLILMNRAPFLWVMCAVTISSLVYTAVLWLLAIRETNAGLSFDWNIWRAIATKMWPIAISIIFNVVYLKGDVVILSILGTQADVGLYGAAYRVLDLITQLAMMMMGVMLPLLAHAWSRDVKEDFRKYYQQSFDTMMLFAIPAMVGLMLLARPIMTLVAGSAFADAGAILGILAIAVFGVYLGAVFGHAAVAINKQKQTMWIYISDAVITLIGYLIFIPRYGMAGAAWMTVFSELYAGFLLALTVRHFTKVKLQFITLLKVILATVMMAVAIWATRHLSVLLLVAIGTVVYITTLYVVGGISKTTLKEIFSPRSV